MLVSLTEIIRYVFPNGKKRKHVITFFSRPNCDFASIKEPFFPIIKCVGVAEVKIQAEAIPY